MCSQEALEASLIKSLKMMWLLGNNSIAMFTLKCIKIFFSLPGQCGQGNIQSPWQERCVTFNNWGSSQPNNSVI